MIVIPLGCRPGVLEPLRSGGLSVMLLLMVLYIGGVYIGCVSRRAPSCMCLERLPPGRTSRLNPPTPPPLPSMWPDPSARGDLAGLRFAAAEWGATCTRGWAGKALDAALCVVVPGLHPNTVTVRVEGGRGRGKFKPVSVLAGVSRYGIPVNLPPPSGAALLVPRRGAFHWHTLSPAPTHTHTDTRAR